MAKTKAEWHNDKKKERDQTKKYDAGAKYG